MRRTAILLLALLLLAFLGWKGWNIYTLAQAVRQDAQALQALASRERNRETLAEVETLVARSRQNTAALQREARPLLALTRLLGWVPTYGPDLAAAGPLLEAATHTTAAVDDTLNALAPVGPLVSSTPTLSDTEAILTHLATVRPRLEQARTASQHALATWQTLPQGEFSPLLSSYTERLDPLLPLLDAGIALSLALEEVAPPLLPVAQTLQTTGSLSTTLLAPVQQARPQLEAARPTIAEARAAWEQLPVADLPPALQRRVQQITPLLPLLDAGVLLVVAMDEVAPSLLPLARELQHADALSITLLAPVQQARPQLEAARPTIAEARAAWEQLPVADLPPALQRRVQPVAPLLALLDVGVDITIAADTTAGVVAPLLEAQATDTFSLTVALEHLAGSRAELENARRQMAYARQRFATVPLADLPAPLPTRLSALQTSLDEAEQALDLALIAPHLLGLYTPRTLTFIAQNPDELRATGGFISAVGQVTVYKGDIIDFWVDNTDSAPPGQYPFAPEAFQRYMGYRDNVRFLWTFRDGNWSPDFPTASRMLRLLYQTERGQWPTNMLAFTPTAIQYLLEATGPITVEGSLAPVSAERLPQHIQDEYNRSQELGVHRKAFLEPLMDAILERVQTERDAFDGLALGRAVLRTLNERHLLLSIDHPDVAAILARRMWDGAVQPGEHDFLMVVDTNLGYTKANFYIDQAITYTVDLRVPTAPHATLALRHTHTFPQPQVCQYVTNRDPTQVNLIIPPYDRHTQGCYWDYLRVLVPWYSQLIGIQSQPVPAEWGLRDLDDGTVRLSAGVADTLMFSTFLIVPSGSSRETVFRYRLPGNVLERLPAQAETGGAAGWRYQLTLQKQAGREAVPITVQVHLPEQAALGRATSGAQVQDNLLSWNLSLAADQQVMVQFGP